jgi:erythronate-4-phosphate dehydrogenase
MSVNALAKFFDLGDELKNFYPGNVPLPEKVELDLPENGSFEERLLTVVNCSYNIAEDSMRLRVNPQEFEKLRGNYPLRHEFHNFTVRNADGKCADALMKLGFKLK